MEPKPTSVGGLPNISLPVGGLIAPDTLPAGDSILSLAGTFVANPLVRNGQQQQDKNMKTNCIPKRLDRRATGCDLVTMF